MGNYAHYKSRRKNSKSVIACKYGVGRYIYVVEVAAQGRRYVKVGAVLLIMSKFLWNEGAEFRSKRHHISFRGDAWPLRCSGEGPR